MDVRLPTLHPYQLTYHQTAVRSRWNAIAGGRRSGKSFYALMWLLVGGLAIPAPTATEVNVWLSPTIKQARSIGLAGFSVLLGAFPAEVYETRRGDLSVCIAGKWRFIFSSTDNPDSIRGLPIRNVVLDEAAFHREYAWVNVIRPALADLKGHALFATTYKGFNWFYDIMQAERWNRVTWPTAINPLITPDEIELMAETMDEQAYKQEVLALPTTAAGLVFEKVFSAENIIDDCGPRPGDNLALSIDFGYNDPTAISLYSYHQVTRGRFDTIKIAELERRGKLLEEIIPEIIALCQTFGVDPIDLPCAVDVAGKQHTGVSEWSYIERLRAANVFKIVYKRVEKESAINFMRAQFCNAAGVRSFRVCRRCKRSIDSYTAYEIKDKERPFDDSRHDHFPDADTYFFENMVRPLIGNKEIVDRAPQRHGPPKMEQCAVCQKRFITFTKETMCATCKRAAILEV